MYESVCIFDRLFWFFIRLLQDVRLKALSLVFLNIIIRYMFEEFLYKIPSKYLEAYHSYHRKTWPAKFGVSPYRFGGIYFVKNQF